MDVLDNTVTLPPFTIRFIMGLILLVISALFRFTAVKELTAWRNIFDPVQPSLTASQSPAARVRGGSMGCITGVVANILCGFCLILSLDQILLTGRFFEWLLTMINIQ